MNELDKSLLSEELLTVQNMAIECAKDSFKRLEVGMSEIDACELMYSYLEKNKINLFFHYPFAWFQERTMFKNFSQPLPFLNKSTWNKFQKIKFGSDLPHLGKEFLPTDKVLQQNMAVILDVAPIKDGVFADIGYARFFGENEEYQKMLVFLKKLRETIPSIIIEEKIISKIYRRVDQIISDNGYLNCHQVYPLGVLGHKVGKMPKMNFSNLFKNNKMTNIMGFSPDAFMFLFSKNLFAPFHYNRETPYLAEHIDKKISEGHWAIEPHIGNGQFGAKFEEILLINQNSVEWLDKENLNLSDID